MEERLSRNGGDGSSKNQAHGAGITPELRTAVWGRSGGDERNCAKPTGGTTSFAANYGSSSTQMARPSGLSGRIMNEKAWSD